MGPGGQNKGLGELVASVPVSRSTEADSDTMEKLLSVWTLQISAVRAQSMGFLSFVCLLSKDFFTTSPKGQRAPAGELCLNAESCLRLQIFLALRSLKKQVAGWL